MWKLNYKIQYKIDTKYYDFYLPDYNLVIEVMGDYFHANPSRYKTLNEMQQKNIKNDVYKKKLAIDNGYEYIDFWENKINNNPMSIKTKLFKKIQLITEGK
jgi:very-short-patch-repair endonuclease